jgi:hypothetical protein
VISNRDERHGVQDLLPYLHANQLKKHGNCVRMNGGSAW